MYLATLAQMNTLQESRLSAVGRTATQRLKLGQDPVTKASGLYWIWTNYTDAELLAAVPSPKRASIDIAGLTARQQNLASICRRNSGDFRLVYNGIGGQGPAGHGGLRERILEEFRGGEGTGSLAILGSSVNDLARWRYSWVRWDEIAWSPPALVYAQNCEMIERLWRLQYGWPLLCTK
jgi:hypothetical protein